MSELEKSGHDIAEKPAIVFVEKEPSTESKNKLYRPTELQDESPELPHNRSKAPAVSSVSETYKTVPTLLSTITNQVELQELKDSQHRGIVMEKQSIASSGKHKHRVAKKTSSKRRGPITPTESLPLKDMDSEHSRKEKLGLPAQPIPPNVDTITPAEEPTKVQEKRTDDDSHDDIAELRTPRPAEKIIDWSDDGEAGGLPRSESRASRASRVSRVSRAVRQLFCCGVAYSPPSDDDISCHRVSGI